MKEIAYDADGKLLDPSAAFEPEFVPGEDDEQQTSVVTQLFVGSRYGNYLDQAELIARYQALVDLLRKMVREFDGAPGEASAEREVLLDFGYTPWQDGLADEWGLLAR